MAHIGLDIPDEPESDYYVYAVINTFYLANRGRAYRGGAYLSGMAVSPLPLSVRDINDVLAAHPVMVERDLLDACLFAIDDIYLSEANEKTQKASEDNQDTA